MENKNLLKKTKSDEKKLASTSISEIT